MKNGRIKISSDSHALLLMVLAMTSLTTQYSIAATPYPDKAYEATIENSSSQTTSHSWCDGKGHMRTETNISGVNRVSIMDYVNNVTYSIDDQNKTAMKIPFNGAPENDPKVIWRSIGEKVVEGYPCSGKRGNVGGSEMEVWTGKNTGCSVLVLMNNTPVMKLKSWKAITPNPALFAPPASYKITDMSSMMKGMQAGGQR